MLKQLIRSFVNARNSAPTDEKTGNTIFEFEFAEFEIPKCKLMLSKQNLTKFRKVDILQNLETKRSVILGNSNLETAKGILSVTLPSSSFDVLKHQSTVQSRAQAIKSQKEAVRKERVEIAFKLGGFNNDAKSLVNRQLRNGRSINSTMLFMREFCNNPKLKLDENNTESYSGFIYTACCMLARNFIANPPINEATGFPGSHIPNFCFNRYISNRYTNGIPQHVIEAKDYLRQLFTSYKAFLFHQFCIWFAELHDIQHPETNREMTCTLEEARIEEERIKARAMREHRDDKDGNNNRRGNFIRGEHKPRQDQNNGPRPEKKHKREVRQNTNEIKAKPAKSMGSIGDAVGDAFDSLVFDSDEKANEAEFLEDTATTVEEQK